MARKEVTLMRINPLRETLLDGADRKQALENKQQRNGEVKDGDLALKVLVGAPEVFGGTKDVRLELALADGDILQRFLEIHDARF